MAGGIKMRISLKDGVTTVRALMRHPMETGRRKDPETGKLIPAHFIEDVVCELNGKAIMTAHWGDGISKNPYISLRFRGAKPGDSVRLAWLDNLGQHDFITAVIGE